MGRKITLWEEEPITEDKFSPPMGAADANGLVAFQITKTGGLNGQLYLQGSVDGENFSTLHEENGSHIILATFNSQGLEETVIRKDIGRMRIRVFMDVSNGTGVLSVLVRT